MACVLAKCYQKTRDYVHNMGIKLALILILFVQLLNVFFKIALKGALCEAVIANFYVFFSLF